MDDPLLVSVLDGLADGDEQLKSLARGELLVIAVLCDRDALDQFHDEIGPAGLGAAGVEHAGDVGMIHHRQRLALRFEAGDHLLAVHSGLDDLESGAPADGSLLLGHVNHAHAALADLLEELVAADHCAGPFGDRAVGRWRERGSLIRVGWGVGQTTAGLMSPQQQFHLFSQGGIRSTGLGEVDVPFARGLLNHRHKNGANLLEVGCHKCPILIPHNYQCGMAACGFSWEMEIIYSFVSGQ